MNSDYENTYVHGGTSMAHTNAGKPSLLYLVKKVSLGSCFLTI